MRIPKWSLAVACASLSLVSQMESQVRRYAPDTACAPSSRVLHRVSEAVDGYRSGERVWVVAECTEDGKVVATSTTAAAAERVALSEASLWVFGPFVARAAQIAERLDAMEGFIIGCEHEKTTSNMWGTRAPRICPETTIPYNDVRSISLRFTLQDGRTVNRTISRDADAVFLRYSAIEKFVFPYYLRVVGLDGVMRMREQMFGAAAQRPRGTPR